MCMVKTRTIGFQTIPSINYVLWLRLYSFYSLNETLAVMQLLFSEDFGSRPNVSRILVFITNGQFGDYIDEVMAKQVRELD